MTGLLVSGFTLLLVSGVANLLIHGVAFLGVLSLAFLFVLGITLLVILGATFLFVGGVALLFWHIGAFLFRHRVYLGNLDCGALFIVCRSGEGLLDSGALLPGFIPALLLPHSGADGEPAVCNSNNATQNNSLHHGE